MVDDESKWVSCSVSALSDNGCACVTWQKGLRGAHFVLTLRHACGTKRCRGLNLAGRR